MFKKNVAYLYLLAVSLFFTACNKDISPDEPFPDVRKHTVFVTTNNNRLYGYDTDNGTKLWEKTTNGICIGTPTITNDAIFLMTDAGKVYGWDLKTQEKKFDPLSFTSSSVNNSLAGNDNRIFIPADSVYCYDTDGNKVWAYNGGAPATTAITLSNNRLYIGFINEVHCLDLDGNFMWKSPATDVIITTLKATNDGIFFGAADNKMYCIEIPNGALRWSYTTSATVLSSPLIYGGMSISGSDDNNIYCVDMLAGPGQQGLLRWSVPTQERVRSSAAIHVPTNTVLIGCHDFNLYAINHVTGDLKWKYPTGSLITSSPTILGNKAFFASYDKYMYCIDARTGDLIWKTNMDYSAAGSPVIDNVIGEVYSGQSGMSIY